PEGIDVPPHRYYLTGWGLGHAYVIRPPWSTLTAYDLNRGVIKWQRPVGLDRDAAAEGGTNTGVPQAQRNGMIVTSSGIVFSTAKDGKIYAFDAEDGDILWSGDLPTGTEGLPSYYEIDGQPYLVVTATTPLIFGRSDDDEPPPPDQPRPQGGYVVFSLPK
ncbi:MAG TPA: PQQ-binding-like beta-propeller repeat protein, partial [Rhodothermales bacterium]